MLTGPSGRLFRPMADTMAFALLGSLLCSLTLLPVLCAYLPAEARQGAESALRARAATPTTACSHVCLRHRIATIGGCLALFGGSLLLMPFIGAEFMPHLDEGALWVRATMPYTISFEEASKLGPRCATCCSAFPQVTTVANELGRPDDGTDPIGFFNDEYFVGLKPYDDPAWSGSDPHEAAADRRDPAEAATRFPESSSTTRSRPKMRWTRPKPGSRARSPSRFSAPTSRRSNRKAEAVAARAREGARHHGHHAGARARPAEPDDRAGPREDRALRPERRRHQHPDRDRDRRHCRPRK